MPPCSRGADEWKAISATSDAIYNWDPESTYIQEPPFFVDLSADPTPLQPIAGARALVKLGDSITTDHISPAGAIAQNSPAGQYLLSRGVERLQFNSYGSRRGNDRVMTRGTFANIRIQNELAPGTEGGYTTDFTDGEVKTIYEAAKNYTESGVPLVVLAGTDYGMGSSRDWAAKGAFELGVKVVIADSLERIHRSNLVMMGVLPLTFLPGQNASSLGIDGTETFSIDVDDELQPRQDVVVTATRADGSWVEFVTACECHTPIEVEYLPPRWDPAHGAQGHGRAVEAEPLLRRWLALGSRNECSASGTRFRPLPIAVGGVRPPRGREALRI